MNVRCLAAAVGVVLAAAVLVAAGESPAADPAAAPGWPEFHGAGRTNVSPDKGLLKQWPEGGPPLVWKYSECGEGYSGVSIADGMIFTAGYVGGKETVLALDMDGKLLWKAPNGEAWSGPSPGSRTTPTFSEGVLYQMSAAGRLAAFQAKTGKPVWAVDLVAQFGAKFGVWAAAENVIVDGDKVLCMPGGPKGRVVALDKRSGKTLWANTEIEHTAAYCSPLIVTYRGVRQLVTMTQKSVMGVEVETGRPLNGAEELLGQHAHKLICHTKHLAVPGPHAPGCLDENRSRHLLGPVPVVAGRPVGHGGGGGGSHPDPHPARRRPSYMLLRRTASRCGRRLLPRVCQALWRPPAAGRMPLSMKGSAQLDVPGERDAHHRQRLHQR